MTVFVWGIYINSFLIKTIVIVKGLGYKDMLKRDIPASIDIACRNASDSCTLSGPTEDVINYVKELKKENIFAKAVSAGNIAYHSRYIQPIAPKLLEYLSEVMFIQPYNLVFYNFFYVNLHGDT